MEHMLQKSKCSIFHNIFKYMIFHGCLQALLYYGEKGSHLKDHADVYPEGEGEEEGGIM